MDKIYFTSNLFSFSTKIFPENAIIINLQKFDNYNFIQNLIPKLNIKNIYCENNHLCNIIKKYTNITPININESNLSHLHIYQDKSIYFYLYFIIISSVLTFFILNVYIRNQSNIIALTLFINFIFWMITFYSIIHKHPYQHISTYS